MVKKQNQTPQTEQDHLETSVDMWKRKVEDLERTLAMQEEELSKAVLKRRTRTLIHVETLEELRSSKAALDESQYKCAALEESLNMKLQERQETLQRQLKEKEESVKEMMEEKFERELDERKQRFEDDLRRKEEALMLEQALLEEKFIKEKIERDKQFDEELCKKERWLEQQLQKREEEFNIELTDMFLQWMSRAEGMGQKQKELEHQLQDSIRRREQDEEQTKEEIQRLSEEISQLQVRHLNLRSFKLFLIISKI